MNKYDPKKVTITFGTNIITGYAKGSFVKVTKDEENFKLVIGADGEGTRVKNNNNSGTIELTLRKGSTSNDILSTIASADKTSEAGVLPFLLIDKSGTSSYAAEQCWIEKEPDGEFSDEETNRTWKLRTDKLVPYHGGN